MAMSLSQGAAVAAALVSKVVGEGFVGVVVPSDDDFPVALAPLFAAFERFFAAGGPNDLDLFIGNFFGGDTSGSSVRECRATAGQDKRMREIFEKFSSQQKKMIKAAEEPMFYQVVTLLTLKFT